MGMITAAALEEGVCFGPLPTDLMIADPAYLIAQTTADQLSELPTVVVNPHKLSDPIRLIEWVCNLRSARNPTEQNVELIRLPSTGQSFYHLVRRVEVGEELFVWFRRWDLTPLLGELFRDKRVFDAWNGRLIHGESGDREKSSRKYWFRLPRDTIFVIQNEF
ncbi:hypothetical protein FGIG_08799 [Fasciola gigantica]|uniref:Uncharacterized protein n=1 Tax=Fasciola gigantica TaxID=46835 RepID=A0A504Y513_FASGI|nr:hypothetical protein FGIG_08799 [Fasciola gigantica]